MLILHFMSQTSTWLQANVVQGSSLTCIRGKRLHMKILNIVYNSSLLYPKLNSTGLHT